MEKLIEYIAKEWSVVSQAPFIFLILSAIVFGLAYMAAKWRFTAIIEQLKASNETQLTRLHLKSEQAETYKDRALKYDEKVQNVVDSDAAALKDRTLTVVNNLRDFIERYKREDEIVNTKERSIMSSGQTEEELNIVRGKSIAEITRLLTERNAEYERRFRVDAMLLRDELRSRIPDYKPLSEYVDLMYEHPTNYFGFNDVASDLERMAKMVTSVSG